MANPEHLKWLVGNDVEAWNERRRLSPFVPDLEGATVRGAKLWRADLQEADLQEADLREVDLRGAKLWRADLQEAKLQEAKLQWADLREVDLRGAKLWRADLQEADLQEADVRTVKSSLADTGFARADFTHTRYLTQKQVDSMRGDTGVLLPEGLKHPAHWPKWEGDETESEVDETSDAEAETVEENGLDGSPPPDTPFDGFDLVFGPYVFLSYQSNDREKIADIREKLIAEDILCWWDQDIEPGDQWRSMIKGSLENANVVLTFWTENSVGSDAVKEEASTAQKAGTFAHVRLDNSELPYGYAETQYLSLVEWNGDVEDPRWKRLVSVLKDRLNPPGLPSKISRIANTGSRTAVLSDGRIDAVDTPPDGRPEIEDEKIKQLIFDEIILNCEDLGKIWELKPLNTSLNITVTIARAKSQADAKNDNWFSWDRLKKQLKRQIDIEDHEAWCGFDIEVQSLIENIDHLRKVLKPIKLDGSAGEPPNQQPPEISLDADSTNDINQLSNEIGELLSDPLTSEVLTEEAQQQLAEDRAELDEGLEQEDNPNEEVRARRFSLWRYALRGIGGFVATAVAVLTGAAVNLLTSPEAAKTLLTRLEQLLELILKFF